ncbi:hypothetical protein L596_016731 [Steinernema carpocapsae]|uniref:EB domain-containing protein n=1 Tax=Steinernema carpocapsae TaxID=34508 RepID=A0A4U5NJY1_STECR|nr:hypothetical protein L596_016731 [Steinernema carpocapsae]
MTKRVSVTTEIVSATVDIVALELVSVRLLLLGCLTVNSGSGQCGLGQINVNGFCYSLAGYLQRCDTGEQCSFPGGICITNVCRCTPGFVFSNNECQVDSNVIPPLIKACNANQVFINQQCLSIAGVNGPCFYDLQCQEPGNSLLFCSNGFCQYRSGGNGLPVCQAPGMQPEIVNGVAKNCLQQYCSAGYQCEYNRNYRGGQYICCGSSNSGFYGAIKMYPGMNKPLQCFAINSCTFVDYPHCVFSQRYGHNVCCSKKNCY